MNSLRSKSLIFSKRAFSSIPAGCYLPSNHVAERVLTVIRGMKNCPDKVTPSSNFVGDLNFDSTQRRELNDKLAAEFCVRIDAPTRDSFISVESAVKYFASHPKAR